MSAPPPRANRLLLILMLAMMVAAAIAVVTLWQFVRDGPRDQVTAQAAIGGAFSLTDQSGKIVTEQTYKGLYRLVYFGYTFCPDACPTELQTMALAIDELGPLGAKVQPIFITVDPERDTVKQLAGYVPLFHPRLVGLTGTADEIASVAKAYKVYYAKAEESGSSGYLMNHSSFVYLMDPDGKFITVLPHDMDSTAMAAEIRKNIAPS